MITPFTPVVGVPPRITRDRFVQILRDAETEAVHEANDIYDSLVALHVDPTFALAIFKHESTWGRYGICKLYQTSSPGNTRTTRTGVGVILDTSKELVIPNTQIKIPPQNRGNYVWYPNWTEGFRDLAFRLVDPTYVYAQRGLVTIGDILPVWAPSSDGNSPTNYINAVVRDMNQWVQGSDYMSLTIRQSFIPFGNPNRPGKRRTVRGITVHETANTSRGANAEMHRRFTHNGGGDHNVSFHYVVDDSEAIQLLPLNENAWHAGDGDMGPCNGGDIGIELCVNSDGDWSKTLENAAQLLAYLCLTQNIPVNAIKQHWHCSGKNCPANLRRSGWDSLIQRVRDLITPPVSDDVIHFPDNPFEQPGEKIVVGGGFKNLLREIPEHLWLPLFGYPEENETTRDLGDGYPRVTQKFQRVILAWYPPGSPDGVPPEHPFHIRVLLRDEQRSVS